MTTTRRLIAALIATSISIPALALNLSFMSSGPTEYFSTKDFKIMENSANSTLDSAKDGKKVYWKNPKSTAWGYFIPSHAPALKGKPCRNLTVFSSAKSVTNLATYRFCKIQHEWRIIE
jgi:hypothetical protein